MPTCAAGALQSADCWARLGVENQLPSLRLPKVSPSKGKMTPTPEIQEMSRETAAEAIARLRARVAAGKPVTFVGVFSALAQSAQKRYPVPRSVSRKRGGGDTPFERMQARAKGMKATPGEVAAVEDARNARNRVLKAEED